MIRPLALAMSLAFASTALAGDLNPPPGPVVPTMKSLDEVEPSTPIESLPGSGTAQHVISEPGAYHLTGNMDLSAIGATAIRVDVPGVTIDMRGFSIIGNGSETLPAIQTSSITTIRNGIINLWGSLGIDASAAIIVEDMHVQSVGGTNLSMELGVGSIVRDCAFRFCEPLVLGNGSLVRDCVFQLMGDVIDSPDADGVSIINCVMTGQSTTTNDFVIILGDDCVLRSVSVSDEGRGALLAGLRTLVTGCNFSGISNGQTDGVIVSTGSIIRNTSVIDYGLSGIVANFACTIEGCTVVSNNVDGIRCTGNRNIVRNCNVASNGDDGIEVANNSRVEGNQLAFNVDHGIEATNSNHIIGNSSNGDPIEILGDSNVVDSNNVSGTSGVFSVRLDGSHNRFSRNNIASPVFVLNATNAVFTLRNAANANLAGPWDNFVLGP